MIMTSWKSLVARATLAAVCVPLMASFGAADLYVTQVGDGSAALTSASTAVFVQKFSDSGAALSTIALPTVASGANQPLTTSGSATSEGFLKLSADGNYLTLAGYAIGPGTAAVAGTTSLVAPRAVGRITLSSGAVDTTTVFSGDSTYSGGNIRGAVSTNGTDLWMVGNAGGGNGGTRYATLGGTTTVSLSSSPTNIRVVDIVNGQLYVSSASGTFQGVSAVGTGMPTEAGQTTTLLNGFNTAAMNSSYDFWFKDAQTLYVAGDASAVNGGGIQKWTESSGAWTLQYTLLNNDSTTTGVRGLTGTVDLSGNAVLYGTTTATSANQLISVVDTDASATATTLATAPANTAFRGVEFVSASVVPPLNNADFNSDGIVDGNDFLIWQRGFGSSNQPNKSTGDANGDGNVNGLDLTAWKSKFGGPGATAAIAAVPEPASLALVGLAGLALLRFRSRSN